MGLFQDVMNRAKEVENERNILRDNRDQSRGRFQGIVESLFKRGRNLANEPTLTAQDLFSDEIQNLQDNTRANANATKSALSRGMMARGGDSSGAGAVNMLGVDQASNNRMGQITDMFNTLATKIGEARQSRGDSLLSAGMSGASNMFGADTNILSDLLLRNAQKDQAEKTRRSALGGGLLQTVGTIAGAALMACWVAEELYEEEPAKVQQIREFLGSKVGADDDIGEFANKYQLHGDQWADEVRKNPELRKASKRLFDEFYELSKAA